MHAVKELFPDRTLKETLSLRVVPFLVDALLVRTYTINLP